MEIVKTNKKYGFLGLDALRKYLATLNFGTMCLIGLCGIMGFNNFFLFENMLIQAGTPTDPWIIEISSNFKFTLFSRTGFVSAVFSFFFSASIIFYQMRGKVNIVNFFLNFERLAHVYYFVILVTFKDFDLIAFNIIEADGDFYLDDILRSPLLKWHSLIINIAYGIALPQSAKFFANEMCEGDLETKWESVAEWKRKQLRNELYKEARESILKEHSKFEKEKAKFEEEKAKLNVISSTSSPVPPSLSTPPKGDEFSRAIEGDTSKKI